MLQHNYRVDLYLYIYIPFSNEKDKHSIILHGINPNQSLSLKKPEKDKNTETRASSSSLQQPLPQTGPSSSTYAAAEHRTLSVLFAQPSNTTTTFVRAATVANRTTWFRPQPCSVRTLFVIQISNHDFTCCTHTSDEQHHCVVPFLLSVASCFCWFYSWLFVLIYLSVLCFLHQPIMFDSKNSDPDARTTADASDSS